jgi:ribosomal protein S18 acetylase RimI-like enzyme
MDPVEPVKLRILTLKDLDAVAEIDYTLLGKKRMEYWEQKLERAETSAVPSLAAEIGGRVVGFILGNVSDWEYGIPDNIALIDTLGVAKEYQKKGIAQLLFKEMFSMFRKIGINTVYVFVDWKKRDLLNFFDKMNFRGGDMINLELKF